MDNKDSILFYTYLPIQLDATCNGYQHLALLTQETKLLSKLNLAESTHDDDPNDFYSYIANINKESIKTIIEKLPEQINSSIILVKELNNKLNKNNIIRELDKLIYEVDKRLDDIIYKGLEEIKQKSSKNLKSDKKFMWTPSKEFSSFTKNINNQFKLLQIKELDAILNKVEQNIKELKSLIKLDKMNLGRPIIKKVLMRQSYSAGLPTLVDNILLDDSIVEIEKNLFKHINLDVKFTRYDISIYVKSLIAVTRLVAPKINALSKYLNNIVSICTRLQMHVP